MRVALHSVLRPGTELDHDREHERIPDDPANERWQASIGRLVDGFLGGDGDGPAPLPEVWDLGRQRQAR